MAEIGRVNQEVVKGFSVTDINNNLVPSLSASDFTEQLYNPSGVEVSGSIVVTYTELGSGNYEAMYTPNVSGDWFLAVYHTTYFPWGKTGITRIYASDFDTLTDEHKRILGLIHENMYIDQTAFDADCNLISARVRIYDTPANVGTGAGVIGTYTITVNASGPGQFTTWKQVRV